MRRKKTAQRPFLDGTFEASGAHSAFIYWLGFTVGLILLYQCFLQPLFMLYVSRSWTAASCTVLSRGMKFDDDRRYIEEIVYSYEVAGTTYQADRYEFFHTSSKGSDGAQKTAELMAQYRPGSQTTCYVNPHDPTDAVLHRRIGAVPMLFTAPVSLILMGVGFSGMKKQFKNQRQRQKHKSKNS